MSFLLHGIGLGGGIVIGSVYILDKHLDDVTHHIIEEDEINLEIERFTDALKQVRRELEQLRNNIPSDAPAELGAFLSLSIMMLSDSQIAQAPINIIKKEFCSAEWAIKRQADTLALQFDEMQDEYLKERKYDVIQVLERIFKNLEGNKFDWEIAKGIEQKILITHDLSPADLVQFKDSNFEGFITEVGSTTSHTTIVGRNLNIPAIVGVNYARQLIYEDEIVIIDGMQGVLIVNPAPIVLAEYKKRQKAWLENKTKLQQIRKTDAITLDGTHITLMANIEDIKNIDEVKHNNANGIGLFRSEFLFLTKDNHLANEDEQFEAYYKIAKAMKKSPVIIRTADLGVDKNPNWNHESAMNPALGLTGIRLSLAEQQFFRAQLRAILRASYYGNIQVMFPMISSSWELKQAINQLNYAKEELLDENIAFNANIKVGVMIEIPSAALAIKPILALVDFVSIGTNDLIQYLLAIDRNDEAVNYLYNPLHPAVLKVLHHIIKSCNKQNIPVSVCGEMAGDTNLTRLLLGMGLRRFSMYSSSILNIKEIVLNTDINKLTHITQKILKIDDNMDKVEELLEQLNESY